MRQIVLDTETTGLEVSQGHRIIEIGCIELIDRRHSGRHFHQYLNPERDIDAGASAVHGLSRERLVSAPKFAEVVDALLEFIIGSELIIHNAPFDVAFLDMELALLARARAASVSGALAVQRAVAADADGGTADAPAAAAAARSLPEGVRAICSVLDTLALARARHPGQRNNLDALCKRYGVDNSRRDLHGALLDARLLADVYLSMTGGQSVLALDEAARERAADGAAAAAPDGAPSTAVPTARPAGALRVIEPSAEELSAHAALTALLQQASGGRCVWLRES